MYQGLGICWPFLSGTEKQSYQFFYLFVVVPLTQHHHHSAYIFLLCVICFFQIQLYHFVPMLVTNVSNTRSAKTYYINRLTHTRKNCKRVTTINPIAQLTDWLTNELVFCSHVILAPIAGVVNCIFWSSNILSISLYITEWKLKKSEWKLSLDFSWAY
jgi:hypothetical protein